MLKAKSISKITSGRESAKIRYFSSDCFNLASAFFRSVISRAIPSIRISLPIFLREF